MEKMKLKKKSSGSSNIISYIIVCSRNFEWNENEKDCINIILKI